MTAQSASRCETPRVTPLDWHYFHTADGIRVVAAEIVHCFEGLAPAEKKMRQVELRERLADAASGTLICGDKLDAVWSQPDLWEIRWQFDGAPWRMYHAEPIGEPNILLALKFHEKSIVGSQSRIRREQNREMQNAAVRYSAGQSYRWGIA